MTAPIAYDATLTRYRDDAPVDYMVLAGDGEWVPASEALAIQSELRAAVDLLRRYDHDNAFNASPDWGEFVQRVRAFLDAVGVNRETIG